MTQFELIGYTVYMDDKAVGDIDINIPGDGEPFIMVEPFNFNRQQLLDLANFLDTPKVRAKVKARVL